MAVRAQLVADGQTNVLDGMAANFIGSITVGTNGSFTLLILTNGATVTSGNGDSAIGYNASAETNRVVVTGSGSFWNNKDPIYVGQNGSFSELDILNGGVVQAGSVSIGRGSASSNNLVLVSGTGSALDAVVGVENSGSGNTLIVTNGGTVNGGGSIGESSSNNVALITGSGSSWNCSGYFYFGYTSSGQNLLTINNGGTFATPSTLDIGVYANSNVCTVADSGSSVSCQTYRLGYSSIGNQCVVSNGATLVVTNSSSQATVVEGKFSMLTITGAGSLWTNNVDFDFGQSSNTLLVTSGGKLADLDGYIEGNTGNNPATNMVVVAGANSSWYSRANLYIADSGARLFITNGGIVSDQIGYIGENTGDNNGYVLVDGAGSVWTNRVNPLNGSDDGAFYLGEGGETNTLMISDSGEVAAPDIYINNNSRLIMTNSGILLAVRDALNGSSGELNIGNSSSPNQMIVGTNAMVNVGNTMQIGNFDEGVQKSNTMTINGGMVIVSNGITVASPGSLVLNSGTFHGGVFTIDNYSMQTNAIVLNGGALQSGGIGYGSEAYPIPLTVGDGVHGAIFQMVTNAPGLNSGLFTGGFNVANNAWLTGDGTVNGSVTVSSGGTFAPGITNLASVTVNGSLLLNNGSTTLMALQPSSVSACNVSGLTNVVYGGTLQLTNLGGAYQAGQSFSLFSSTQYNGAFAALSPATPGNGLQWDTYALDVNGTLRIVSATPSPPVIGSVAQAAGNLTITASDGLAYDPCYLLTSTNLAMPLSSWTCVATNYFNLNGTTTFTYAISTGEPARFFQLQVN